MPARPPPVGERLEHRLKALGARIREHRKRHKVTATSAAEAAGLSRVTLHRIERGEPSVTMGSYLGAMAAVGLDLEVVDQQQMRPERDIEPEVPASIRLADYPQLARLAWQRGSAAEVTPKEALNLYERNWRHVDPDHMEPRERALVRALVATLGGGRLLV